MITGIDHLVIASVDPDAAAATLETALGLRAGGGGRHEALGTFNRLVWLGDSYLELIGAWDRALAAASWIGAPTLRALEAGGGLATWALASDGLLRDVEALRGRGSDLGLPRPGERVRPDGRVVRWSLSAGRTLGPGEPPFLIEHDLTGAEWTSDERAARSAEPHPVGGPARLETLEVAVPDVARAAGRFQRAVGIGPFRPSLAGRGARDAVVGTQTLRLRPGGAASGAGGSAQVARGRAAPGAGGIGAGSAPMAVVHLRVEGAPPGFRREVELCGCRWVVRGG